jgi:hypothetical protein
MTNKLAAVKNKLHEICCITKKIKLMQMEAFMVKSFVDEFSDYNIIEAVVH